jgi:hypothetical protein
MEALYVLCQVQTVSVCVMWVNLNLRGDRVKAQGGSMVGRERWTGLSASSAILTVSITRRVWKAHLHLDITLIRRTSGRSLAQSSALTDVGTV